MIHYPHINPVVLQLGSFAVHWYGLMYLLGFTLAWLLGSYRAKRVQPAWTQDEVSDLVLYGALGVILGGRIGYMFFYDLPQLIHYPLSLFQVWQGGMSFHGGVLGVLLAMWLFSRRYQKNICDVTDFVTPLIPLGLLAGRIGNFINGELWGKVTHLPWGIIFPTGGSLPRHPTELYEAFLEGFILFLILWFFSKKQRPPFAVSALFLLCYGVFRCAVEFYRIPDPQYGYLLWGWVTMGQILSLPMILVGGFSFWYAYAIANKRS